MVNQTLNQTPFKQKADKELYHIIVDFNNDVFKLQNDEKKLQK